MSTSDVALDWLSRSDRLGPGQHDNSISTARELLDQMYDAGLERLSKNGEALYWEARKLDDDDDDDDDDDVEEKEEDDDDIGNDKSESVAFEDVPKEINKAPVDAKGNASRNIDLGIGSDNKTDTAQVRIRPARIPAFANMRLYWN
jgi:hypothetical protein